MTFRKIRNKIKTKYASKFSLFFSLVFLCTVRLTRGSEWEHVYFYVAGVNWTIHLMRHRSQSLLSSCTQSWPNFFDTWQKPAVALHLPGPAAQQLCCVLESHRWNEGNHFTHIPPLQHSFTRLGGQPVCLEEFTLLNTHPCPYLVLISTRSRCWGCRRYLSSFSCHGSSCCVEFCLNFRFAWDNRCRKSKPQTQGLYENDLHGWISGFKKMLVVRMRDLHLVLNSCSLLREDLWTWFAHTKGFQNRALCWASALWWQVRMLFLVCLSCFFQSKTDSDSIWRE